MGASIRPLAPRAFVNRVAGEPVAPGKQAILFHPPPRGESCVNDPRGDCLMASRT